MHRGHLGLTVGDAHAQLHAGGFLGDSLGAEFGLRHDGRGRPAEGLPRRLVLRAPPAPGWHVFGKAGALSGRTRSAAGRASGWGPQLAAGIGYALTPRSALVVEWSLGRYRLAGGGHEDVDALGIGAVHRF